MTFKAEAGLGSCEECAAGTYNTEKGSTSCKAVPSGSYLKDGSVTSCPVNTKCAGGAAQPEECPAGEY